MGNEEVLRPTGFHTQEQGTVRSRSIKSQRGISFSIVDEAGKTPQERSGWFENGAAG